MTRRMATRRDGRNLGRISRLAVLLALIPLVPPVTAQAVAKLPTQKGRTKLLASDGDESDSFGESVAIDGATLVVGADEDEELDGLSGSAYVYERDESGAWVEVAKLLASDGQFASQFGGSVAVSGDTVAVGAFQHDNPIVNGGAAYVYERDESGTWVEVAKLLASDEDEGDNFGAAVAIDGDTLVVGAYLDDDLGGNSGAVYIFERDEPGMWVEVDKLVAADTEGGDWFGVSVAIDGDTLVVGAENDDDVAHNSGAAYIFERDESGTWVEVSKLRDLEGEADAVFGFGVAISGETVAVGPGRAGESSTRAVLVFDRDESGTWTETAKLLSPDSYVGAAFGLEMAIFGDRLVAGDDNYEAPDGRLGAAYVFERDSSGTWAVATRLVGQNQGQQYSAFGFSLALSGDNVLVGDRQDDDLGNFAGAAYVFSSEGCVLELRIASEGVRAGEDLPVELYLQHNRFRTAEVPFILWVEDEAGAVVTSLTTPPITFHYGDEVNRRLTVPIPEGTPPGRYLLLVGIRSMQQGTAGAVGSFEVEAVSPLRP